MHCTQQESGISIIRCAGPSTSSTDDTTMTLKPDEHLHTGVVKLQSLNIYQVR